MSINKDGKVRLRFYLEFYVPENSMCEKCGSNPVNDVHHLRYRLTPDDLKTPITDLVKVLCRDCHKEHHQKLPKKRSSNIVTLEELFNKPDPFMQTLEEFEELGVDLEKLKDY